MTEEELDNLVKAMEGEPGDLSQEQDCMERIRRTSFRTCTNLN